MIHRLSKVIANFLLHKNIIPETEIDVYIYGYETVILGSFFLAPIENYNKPLTSEEQMKYGVLIQTQKAIKLH